MARSLANPGSMLYSKSQFVRKAFLKVWEKIGKRVGWEHYFVGLLSPSSPFLLNPIDGKL